MNPSSAEITALLKAAQSPVKRWLWTEANAVTFTPEVVDEALGDGRALFKVTTIHNRPRYWLVRGCSSWSCDEAGAPDDAPEMCDAIDDVEDAIAGQFGSMSHYERDENGDWVDEDGEKLEDGFDDYPTINPADGRMWERIDWPELPGVALAKHPFSNETILAETTPAAV